MRFDFGDFLLRWFIALILVFVTYNPTPWSYVGWVLTDLQAELPYKALAGLVLLVGYVIYLRATFSAIGLFGVVLIAAIFGAIVWVLSDLQLFDPGNRDLTIWIVLVAVATILGVGVSWSHVRRRISGINDVDDVET